MTTLWRVRPVRSLAVVAVAGLVGAVGGVPALVLAPTRPAMAAVIGAGAGSSGPMTLTQTMDQWYVSGQPGKQASVTVSQTTDLTRQRINVSWAGLRPSTSTDYPVMVLQCWGAPTEVKPQNCWTDIRTMDRATLFDNKDFRRVSETDPYRQSYYEPMNLWGDRTPALQYASPGYLPLVTRDGDWYIWGASRDQTPQWRDQKVISTPPPDRSDDTANYTGGVGKADVDGKGGLPFEVLTDFETPSLGCTEGKACSLLVIPIGDPNCRARNRYMAPFSSPTNTQGTQVEKQCTGASPGMRGTEAWKSPTNWERRFAFPLTFRKPFQACELTNRPETTLVGSQMARPLMASWRPKFCTDEKLFKLGHTALGDGDARRQFSENGAARRESGVNAVLTSRAVAAGDAGRPVVHSPVTITSVAVAFVLDDANGREVQAIRFTPRLLAKLITQSYPGIVGSQQPSLVAKNPQWWGADPEFLAVNKDVALKPLIAYDNFTPVLVQGDHDLVHALTHYIAADPQAVAWLNGEPDEYSNMVVNPAFRGYSVPIEQFELRDAWRTASSTTPHQPFADVAWFNIAANDARDLLEGAIATMQSRPLANLKFERSDNDAPDTYKRLDRQPVGVRNMLAIMDLADARQFQLRTAALQTRRGNTPAEGTFVEPTLSGMQYAMEAAVVDEKTGVFSVDHKKLSQYGYPGTMGIYAGLPTAGLPKPLADRYATFLEYAAGPGQTAGTAIGQLPPGYLPLTQPLRDHALKVAAAVRSQQGEVPEPPEKVTAEQGTGTTSRPASPAPPASTPAAGAAPVPSVAASPSKGPALATVSTQTATSKTARWALPALLAVGLAAAVLTPVVALAGQPGHPVRQFASQAVRGMLRRRAT